MLYCFMNTYIHKYILDIPYLDGKFSSNQKLNFLSMVISQYCQRRNKLGLLIF